MTLPDIEMAPKAVLRWRDQRPGHEGEHREGTRADYEEYQRDLVKVENRRKDGILARLTEVANEAGKHARAVRHKQEPPLADADLAQLRADLVPAFWRTVEAERARLRHDMDAEGLGYALAPTFAEFDVQMAGWLAALQKFAFPATTDEAAARDLANLVRTVAGKLGDELLDGERQRRFLHENHARVQLRHWVDGLRGLPADATDAEKDLREARRWARDVIDLPHVDSSEPPTAVTEPVLEEERDPSLGSGPQYHFSYDVPRGKDEEA